MEEEGEGEEKGGTCLSSPVGLAGARRSRLSLPPWGGEQVQRCRIERQRTFGQRKRMKQWVYSSARPNRAHSLLNSGSHCQDISPTCGTG